MKINSGFTMIELVIVIIVLGILSAVAVPKFINLQDDAKKSAMKGVEGAIHSAANIVYSKAAIDGLESQPNKAISAANGTRIKIDYGYPNATLEGIARAIDLTGFEATYEDMPENNITFISKGEIKGKGEPGDLCILYTAASEVLRIYKVQTGLISKSSDYCTVKN